MGDNTVFNVPIRQTGLLAQSRRKIGLSSLGVSNLSSSLSTKENTKYSVWQSRGSVEKDSSVYEELSQQGIPGNMPRSETENTGSKVGSTESDAGSTESKAGSIGSEAGSSGSLESKERRSVPKEMKRNLSTERSFDRSTSLPPSNNVFETRTGRRDLEKMLTRKPFSDINQNTGTTVQTRSGKYLVYKTENLDRNCPLHGCSKYKIDNKTRRESTSSNSSSNTSTQVRSKTVQMKFGLDRFDQSRSAGVYQTSDDSRKSPETDCLKTPSLLRSSGVSGTARTSKYSTTGVDFEKQHTFRPLHSKPAEPRSFGRSKSDTTVPGPFSQTLVNRFEATASNGGGSGAPASNGGRSGAPASNGGGFGAPASNGGRFGATASNGGGSGPPASNGGGFGAPARNGGGSRAPASNGGRFGAPASNGGGSDQTERKSDSGYFNGYRPFSAGFRFSSSRDAEEKLTSEISSKENYLSEKEENNIFEKRKLTLSRYHSEEVLSKNVSNFSTRTTARNISKENQDWKLDEGSKEDGGWKDGNGWKDINEVLNDQKICAEEKKKEASFTRQRSFPDLRLSGSNNIDNNKTVLRINKNGDHKNESELVRGQGRFSLRGKKAGHENKSFLAPTFSSLTRSFSGLNLRGKNESLRKYKSSTDIQTSSIMEKSQYRKPNDPPLTSKPVRPPRTPANPPRKTSEPSFPSFTPSRPPRKISEPNFPSYDSASNTMPSWATTGRKISSTSSLPPFPSSNHLSSSSLPHFSSANSLFSSSVPPPGRKPSIISPGVDVDPEPGSGFSSRTSPSTLEDETNDEQRDLFRPSRDWPYSSILKTPGKRKSSMKHVEFLDNLSECDYVAREY